MRTRINHAVGRQAIVFAALGDPTRLALMAKLCRGRQRSIAQLAAGSAVTRQAIAKHLRVLEKAGVVRSRRRGRVTLFTFQPRQIVELRRYLDDVAAQWADALARLKAVVDR